MHLRLNRIDFNESRHTLILEGGHRLIFIPITDIHIYTFLYLPQQTFHIPYVNIGVTNVKNIGIYMKQRMDFKRVFNNTQNNKPLISYCELFFCGFVLAKTKRYFVSSRDFPNQTALNSNKGLSLSIEKKILEFK